jgi:hypothetical protein
MAGENGLRETRDLALAAYWKMRGLVIVRATRRGKEFEFLFRDEKGLGDQLAVEFANSEAQKFDSEVRALKKLCQLDGGR